MAPNIIVTIILCILSISFPKSKVVCILFFIFMWTLWGFNLWNGDYVQYLDDYNGTNELETIEFGYSFIVSVCSKYMQFQTYMKVISAIILSSFCYWGIKYINCPALYSLIYFPIFILEYVYIRNYISLTLIVYAVFRIVYQNKSNLVSIIIILIASTIHIFSISFLPLVAFVKFNIKRDTLFAFVVVISFLIIIGSQYIFISSKYLASKFLFYSGGEGELNMSLTSVFLLILVLLSVNIQKNTLLVNSDLRDTFKYFGNINVLTLIFIPLYLLIPYTASRSLRIFILLNLFFYIGLYFNSKKNTKWYSVLGLLFIISSIGYFYSIQTFDFVVEPLYHCNLIWGYDAKYQLFKY